MSELTSSDHAESLAAVASARAASSAALAVVRGRTCIGCRRVCAREDLVRCVATGAGKVVFDFTNRAWGRGAWVHPRTECLSKSARGLTRAFKRPIAQSAIELHEALVGAAWRHVERLLATAGRAGQVKTGTESIERACRERADVMLLLAKEAPAFIEAPCLAETLSRGRVLIVPSMTVMGEWLGTQNCALAALTDSKMAKAIARTIAIAQIPAPARGSRGSDTGTEVG